MKVQDWDRDTGMPIYDYDNSAKLGQAIDRIFAEHDGIDRVTMFCSLSDDLYVGRPNEGLSLGNFSITFRRPDGRQDSSTPTAATTVMPIKSAR